MIKRITACASTLLGVLACVAVFQGLPSGSRASIVAATQDLLTMEYQQVGATEEEAVRLACIRAVHATIGRLLFSDYSIRARDLLDPYIQKNWQRFVASSFVLQRRAERDGFGVRVRVQTYPRLLSNDLMEKRFLYKPKPNPYHYIFLAETVDGKRSDSSLGRRAAIDAIVREGGKVYESGVQVPPDNSDVMADAAQFAAGREAAQRIGAEIFISGRLDTRKVGDKEILYDKLRTYESTVRLSMVRADDGSLLGSIETAQRASDIDEAGARDESVRATVANATSALFSANRDTWRKTVLEQSKFQIMFTDLTEDELAVMQRHLETQLGYGAKARVRTYHGGVAVFSVDTERDYSVLERAVADFQAFDLRITDRQGPRVTVDVHH